MASSVSDWRASSSGATSARRPALLGPFEGAAGGLGVAVFDHVEDRVEIGEHGENRIAVAGEELALIDGGVRRADQVEDGRAGLGGVQVVGQRCEVFDCALSSAAT